MASARQPSAGTAAVARARALFLDEANVHGCAETTFVVLKEAFGLPDATDSSAAMALNGGVAYSGGPCGALTGAALAVGLRFGARSVDDRSDDHASAKRNAREVVARLMAEFEAEFGSVECRALIGRDIRTPVAHAAFIESGIWRTACMAQIEFAVRALADGFDPDDRVPSSPGPGLSE